MEPRSPTTDKIRLTGLMVPCIIGIFDWERKKKQEVQIDLEFPADIQKAAASDSIEDAVDYKKIAKFIIAFVSASRYQLIETLAEDLARLLLSRFSLGRVTLRVSKPGAVRGSRNVGVEVTREDRKRGGWVYFSLGSNLEPSLHLSRAVKALKARFGGTRFSRVYETSPVGGKRGQPHFWNMVAGVETSEPPRSIRRWIASLEKKEGRKRTRDRYGPRTLDVDLILWKDLVVQEPGFSLPHPDIRSKAFVLFPLLEIAPTLRIPGSGERIIEWALAFHDKGQSIRQMAEGVLDP